MGAMINGSLRGVFQESGIRQELSRFVTPQWPSGIFRLVVRETRTLCGRTAFSKGACRIIASTSGTYNCLELTLDQQRSGIVFET